MNQSFIRTSSSSSTNFSHPATRTAPTTSNKNAFGNSLHSHLSQTAPLHYTAKSNLSTDMSTNDPSTTTNHPTSTAKQPAFSTTALNIDMPQPRRSSQTNPSTPPSTYSASSHRETAYLTQIRTISRLRLLLIVLTLGASVSVLALQAHSLVFYNDTALSPELYHISLWPLNLDLRPTVAGIAVGGTIAMLCVIYLLIGLIPSPRPHQTLAQPLFTLLSLLTLPLTTFNLIFTTLTTQHSARPTLNSWTCTFAHSSTRYNNALAALTPGLTLLTSSHSSSATSANPNPNSLLLLAQPANTPSSFSEICTTTTAAWALGLALLCLSATALVLASYTHAVVERGIRRERGLRGDEKGGRSHMSW